MERMNKNVNKGIKFLFHKVKLCGTTYFHSLQKGSPQQTKVRIAPKSNLVRQWVFIGATNKCMGAEITHRSRDDSKELMFHPKGSPIKLIKLQPGSALHDLQTAPHIFTAAGCSGSYPGLFILL